MTGRQAAAVLVQAVTGLPRAPLIGLLGLADTKGVAHNEREPFGVHHDFFENE